MRRKRKKRMRAGRIKARPMNQQHSLLQMLFMDEWMDGCGLILKEIDAASSKSGACGQPSPGGVDVVNPVPVVDNMST